MYILIVNKNTTSQFLLPCCKTLLLCFGHRAYRLIQTSLLAMFPHPLHFQSLCQHAEVVYRSEGKQKISGITDFDQATMYEHLTSFNVDISHWHAYLALQTHKLPFIWPFKSMLADPVARSSVQTIKSTKEAM